MIALRLSKRNRVFYTVAGSFLPFGDIEELLLELVTVCCTYQHALSDQTPMTYQTFAQIVAAMDMCLTTCIWTMILKNKTKYSTGCEENESRGKSSKRFSLNQFIATDQINEE